MPEIILRLRSTQILQEFEKEVKEKLEQLKDEIRKTFDLAEIERILTEKLNELLASLLEEIITELLSEGAILNRLKELGGRLAMRFKEYRTVTLRLGNGQSITVRVPYFTKVPPKDRRRRKKRGSKWKWGVFGSGRFGLYRAL